MSYEFPHGFWWGSATAAHQVEGNNVYNDNWLMEHLPGSMFVEPSGDACDHYHRYPEDIALLASLGVNAYRFSVEWSRIQPEENYFSRAEIEHYRRMLGVCRDHGLTAVVTFHHFTTPRWVIAAGGWQEPATAERFARYCERVARDLGDLIAAGCTLNEPNLLALFNGMGFFPPHEAMVQSPMFQAAGRALGIPPESFAPYLYCDPQRGREVMLAAHRQAIAAVKGTGARFPMGWTLALQDIQAADDSPAAAAKAASLSQAINGSYLDAVREGVAAGLDDFVGVQTYSRMRVGPQGFVPPPADAEPTQMNYEFYPEALEATIRLAARTAGVPVIVTENGLGTSDDTRRVEYIRRAVNGVANCLRDGIPVKGYFYWSLLDNFEWNSGYKMTFGLVAVNRETQQRTVKPSARYLGEIARANRIA